eukprot:scaffold422_cov399-Prasinococcus_capsulatus_cf.AAC.19
MDSACKVPGRGPGTVHAIAVNTLASIQLSDTGAVYRTGEAQAQSTSMPPIPTCFPVVPRLLVMRCSSPAACSSELTS